MSTKHYFIFCKLVWKTFHKRSIKADGVPGMYERMPKKYDPLTCGRQIETSNKLKTNSGAAETELWPRQTFEIRRRKKMQYLKGGKGVLNEITDCFYYYWKFPTEFNDSFREFPASFLQSGFTKRRVFDRHRVHKVKCNMQREKKMSAWSWIFFLH